MQELIINKEKKSVPTSWDEVTLRQLDRLATAKDDLEACAILLDEDIEKLRRAKDIEGFNRVLIALEFLKTAPNFKKFSELDSIKFDGEQYKVKEFEEIEIGQYNDIRYLGAMTWENIYNMYAIVLAVYIQPIVEGCDYSHPKAKALEEKVWDLPACEVIGCIGFFLSQLNESKGSRASMLSAVLIRMMSLWQGLTGWKGSGS